MRTFVLFQSEGEPSVPHWPYLVCPAGEEDCAVDDDESYWHFAYPFTSFFHHADGDARQWQRGEQLRAPCHASRTSEATLSSFGSDEDEEEPPIQEYDWGPRDKYELDPAEHGGDWATNEECKHASEPNGSQELI